MMATAMMPTWASGRRRVRRRRGLAMVGAGAMIDGAFRSVTIMHPEAAEQEVDRGQDGGDQQQEPGKRGGVAHMEVHEAFPVQVQGVEHRGVQWPAGPAADDESWGERLE